MRLTETGEYWFRRFKTGDFDMEYKGRQGRPETFEEPELVPLLDHDLCESQKELTETLGAAQEVIGII